MTGLPQDFARRLLRGEWEDVLRPTCIPRRATDEPAWAGEAASGAEDDTIDDDVILAPQMLLLHRRAALGWASVPGIWAL